MRQTERERENCKNGSVQVTQVEHLLSDVFIHFRKFIVAENIAVRVRVRLCVCMLLSAFTHKDGKLNQKE